MEVKSENITGGAVSWVSPSNIAIIKYWGKKPGQVPINPSLSFTLKNSFTQTSVSYSRKPKSDGRVDFISLFEGKAYPPFSEKIGKYLSSVKNRLPFLSEYFLEITSQNSFPHSAGIASSASAMSALALCLGSIAQKMGFFSDENFYPKVSSLARIGSGSAARSVYGGWVTWGASPVLPESSDEFAIPFSRPVHPVFDNLNDSILIVDSSKKQVSSSEGHRLMENHPQKNERILQANRNFEELLDILATGDFMRFAEIAEEEAFSIHRLMESSEPSYSLLKQATFEILDRVRKFRKSSGLPVCFTLDAGPNVHLIYPEEVKPEIQNLIKTDLLRFCESGRWIDDRMGAGPVQKNDNEKI